MPAPTKLARIHANAVSSSVGRRLRSFISGQQLAPAPSPSSSPPATAKSLTTLQKASPRSLSDVWFNAALPLSEKASSRGPRSSRRPEDEPKAKLGKTLRILQERLPTLLQSPLPQEVLSPSISLHLFPSTHPHLPAVSGRVAYIAALWTSPIAWNRLPVVGNVRLDILSERMVSSPVLAAPRRAGAVGEQLVVRWRTATGASDNDADTVAASPAGGGGGEWKAPVGDALPSTAGGLEEGGGGGRGAFTGLFIFEFDGEGRILSHTIEHVEEGGQWEKGVGAKFVGLTDWLLGGIRGGRSGSDTPCPAFARRER